MYIGSPQDFMRLKLWIPVVSLQ